MDIGQKKENATSLQRPSNKIDRNNTNLTTLENPLFLSNIFQISKKETHFRGKTNKLTRNSSGSHFFNSTTESWDYKKKQMWTELKIRTN